MTTDVRKADVHEVFERYHVCYEVRPYYVIWDQRPEGAPATEQKVQAGYGVDLYAAIEKYQVPPFDSEEARMVVDYLESVAREVQAAAGQHCTVEVIQSRDSLVLDTQKHFQPQVTLQIRISHDRGLDQPAGPSEEQALQAVREALHELGVRES
jgi:hypothetical protein